MSDLLDKIRNLEQKHKKHFSPANGTTLDSLHISLLQCLECKEKDKCRYYSHRCYAHWNKCSHLLARLLKKEHVFHQIHRLEVQNKPVLATSSFAHEFLGIYPYIISHPPCLLLMSKPIRTLYVPI